MSGSSGALYVGRVMHQRMLPFGHRLNAPIFSLLIDLDRLGTLFSGIAFAAVDRAAPVSFHQRDHGPRDGTPLRAHVDRLLAEAGRPRAARVRLLTTPRVFGTLFNPLSVYYAHDADGRLDALLYEVRNTFGDMHTYVVPVVPDAVSPAGVRQDARKAFFVSPFLGFDLAYRFRVTDPAERLTIRILEVDRDGRPVFAATQAAQRADLTAGRLLRAVLRIPVLGLNIMARIHWHALLLWAKGARFHHRPPAPAPASFPLDPPRGAS